jgi:hypothetical protein
MNKGAIVLFKNNQGIEIKVNLYQETVWLDAHLIASLFNVKRPAIVKHIQNIYKSDELREISTCSILEQVAADGKLRKMKLYNLDLILSVGYRVNSKDATQFRQWATQRLKDYLVQGYAINHKRLEEAENKFQELKQTVKLLENVVKAKEITGDEAQGLLKVLSDYAFALDILDQYDHQTLKIEETDTKEVFKISYPEAKKAIEGLKTKFGGSQLFGNEKDDSFKSSLETIYQTFDGIDLYPSVQEKKQVICCILSPKTIRFRMVTKELLLFYLFGF